MSVIQSPAKPASGRTTSASVRSARTSTPSSSTPITPGILVGQDHGSTPTEFVLHALAVCLTADLANIAAARRVKLNEVRSTVTGDIGLNGIVGLSPDARNGYQQITVRFTIKGDAPAETLRELIEQSRARSAVADPGPVRPCTGDRPGCIAFRLRAG